MNNIWFTADTHFGHKNIIGFEPIERSFNSVEEMNETLIERWNSVIKPNDTVYHLGDFCFGKHNVSIAGRLSGKKRLVLGNHDTYSATEYLSYFDKLYGAKDWEGCILTHIPVHPSNLGSRFILNIHGHLHSKTIENKQTLRITGIDKSNQSVIITRDDPQYFCVSVEQNNLMPIHADIIRDIIKRM